MGLFEDVVVNAKSAVNVFSKKAGELVDVSKLKINSAELHNEMSKKFEQIGKETYNSVKNDGNINEQVKILIVEIDKLYQELDQINQQIAVMKNKCKCKECGCINNQDSFYCCKCGAKIVDHEPSIDENPEA